MIYELIQPSDPIHFKAESDKIAYYCALVLGNGKAGVRRTDGEECASPILFLHPDPMPIIEQYLGASIEVFGDENAADVADCFDSFSYGDLATYRLYCEAVEAITEPEKLKAFKASHEDKNRSSLSTWVKGAWRYAEFFRAKAGGLVITEQ